MPFRVSVIGAGEADDRILDMAREVGAFVGQRGWVLVTGGLAGVMEAASHGAREAGGLTVGILPGIDPGEANPHVAVPVVTGMGFTRNALVVHNGDVVVAVGGRYGTLSEMAYAKVFGKPVLALQAPDMDGIDRADGVEAVKRWLEAQEQAWTASRRSRAEKPP